MVLADIVVPAQEFDTVGSQEPIHHSHNRQPAVKCSTAAPCMVASCRAWSAQVQNTLASFVESLKDSHTIVASGKDSLVEDTWGYSNSTDDRDSGQGCHFADLSDIRNQASHQSPDRLRTDFDDRYTS